MKSLAYSKAIRPLKELIERKGHSLVPFFLLLLLFLLKWPTLHLPYFWDEILSHVGPAHELFHNGLERILPWIGRPDEFFMHPRGFVAILAFCYKVFGESISITRSLALLFCHLAMYFTYQVGRVLGDTQTGLLAALFFFFNPIVYAQSTQYLPDVALTGAGMAMLYYALTNRMGRMAVWGILAASIRESALAFFVPISMYVWWQDRGRTNKEWFWTLFPLLWLASYFLDHWLWLGKWNGHDAAAHFIFTWDNFLMNFKHITLWVFRHQKRTGMTLLGLLLIFWWALNLLILMVMRRRFPSWRWRNETALLLGIAGCFILGFSFDKGVLDRYLIPVVALISVLLMEMLRSTFKWKWPSWAFVVLYILYWHPYTGHGPLGDMGYVKIIENHLEGVRFLERNFPDKVILAPWPVDKELEWPYIGYVGKGLNVHNRTHEPFGLLVLPDYGHREMSIRLKEVILERKLKLLKRFSNGVSQFDIYTHPKE